MIALICPKCEASLPTAKERRVFVCDGCGRSVTPPAGGSSAQGSMWVVPRRMAQPTVPLPELGRIVLLPLWVLPIRREELGVWGDRMPSEIRIPAVGVSAMSRLLRFGEILTRAPKSMVELDGGVSDRAGVRPCPAELSLEDAYATAEILALAHVEGWPPDPEVDDLAIPFGALRMVDLPCQHWSGSLTDLVFGLATSDHLMRGTELPDQRELLRHTLSTVSD